MTHEVPGGDATYMPSDAVDLQHRVADFRAAWQRGSRPAIGDCLKDVPPLSQAKLFRELLQIEFACRAEKRDPPALAEYLKRFPDNDDIIRQLFDEHFKGPELKAYEHLELLGGGGMGVVYKARQTTLGRTVAIKFLAENALTNQKMIARFRQESHSIGQLSHENIVQAYDAGEDGGRQFLVMEFVEGVCLSDLIKARGGLPPADVCEIVRQVCDGLEYARKKGVVHRDIKPSNLMLTSHGVVKILDFGLACIKLERDDSQGLTTDGCAMGTLDYMAPEQFDARTVDHRADIYSLGCTMFSLLAGRPPFGLPEYSTDIAKMKAHALDPTPRVDDARSDVPPAVADVVCRMMAKHRDDRYETAAAVGKALTPLAEGADLEALAGEDQPSVGATDTKPHSIPRTVRDHKPAPRGRKNRLIAYCRKRPGVVAGVAAGLVLAAGLVAMLARRPASKPNEIRFEDAVATLPGLDGNWWFDEIPWLTPEVRQQFIDRVVEHAKSSDPNSEIELEYGKRVKSLTDLLNGSDLYALKKPLHADPLATGEIDSHLLSMYEPHTLREYYDNLNLVRGGLLTQLGGPTDSKDSLPAAANFRAVDCHLLAVVDHRMACLPFSDLGHRGSEKPANRLASVAVTAQEPDSVAAPTRAKLWDEAAASYKRAADDYAQHGNYQMQALCLADWGQLYLDQHDYKKARPKFKGALVLLGNQAFKAPFFEACVNGSYADACSQLGNIKEAKSSIDAAEKSASLLPENHPLRAYVKERKAWCFMDAVDPDNARDCFEDAIKVRGEIGKFSENDKASEMIFIFNDRQGLTLAEQYRATLLPNVSAEVKKTHLAESHRQFEQLLKDIQSVPDSELTLRTTQELKNCWASSAERDADGDLFGDPRDFKRAADSYRDVYQELKDKDETEEFSDRSLLVAGLLLKETIALACTGDPRDSDRARALERARKIRATLAPAEQNRLEFAELVAQSAVDWKQAGYGKRPAVEQDIVDGLARFYADLLIDQSDRRDVHLSRNQQLLDNLLGDIVDPGKLHAAALQQAKPADSEN